MTMMMMMKRGKSDDDDDDDDDDDCPAYVDVVVGAVVGIFFMSGCCWEKRIFTS